jgi:hypothetical protein
MENEDEETPQAYQSLLNQFAETHPLLAESLRRAHDYRLKRLEHLISGSRLAGLEALSLHLTKLENTFQSHPDLNNIAFLINRVKGDYEKALEAALSGLHSVASDSMRGVMEIEFLLRDFLHEPKHINEWLTSNEKERYKKFKPAALRERHAQRLGNKPQDMSEAVDYKGHSMFLHVSPVLYPFGGNAISKSDDIFFS